MRSTLLALPVLLAVSFARADEPSDQPSGAPPAAPGQAIMDAYAPLHTVGIILDTQQVLFFDDVAKEYRLAKVGDTLEGWRVVLIDVANQKVAVMQDNVRDELALVKLPHKLTLVSEAAVAVAPPVAAPAMPAARPPVAQPIPAPAPVAVPAPAAAPAPVAGGDYEDEPMTAPPPAPEAAARVAPQPPTVRPSQGTDYRVVEPGAEPTRPRVVEENHVVMRAELNHELTNFDRLMTGVELVAARGGGFLIMKLDGRSWIATTGLRQGDIVRSIAGERVSTIEDAARVYARMPNLNAFVVEVDRNGQRVILHFDIR
jgi:type II secretory pathway component PulC